MVHQTIKQRESLNKTKGILATIFLERSFQVEEMIKTTNGFLTTFSSYVDKLYTVNLILRDGKDELCHIIENITIDSEHDVHNLSADQKSKKELCWCLVSIGMLVAFNSCYQRYEFRNSEHFDESIYQKLSTFQNQHPFRDINDLKSLKYASLLARPFNFVDKNGTSHTIKPFYLPVANENISVLIKDKFTRARSIYLKSVAKTPVHSSIDSIMSNLSGLPNGSGSKSLTFEIFSNSDDIPSINQNIKQLSSIYPNNDVLVSVTQVINGNSTQFNTNIKTIYLDLKKQCFGLSSNISEKEFKSLLNIMKVLEFNFQFQCYKLKKWLKKNDEMKNWNSLFSKIAKTRKRQRLNLNNLISGSCSNSLLIHEFKFNSANRIIVIKPFPLEPIAKIIALQLKEVSQILSFPFPSVSGKEISTPTFPMLPIPTSIPSTISSTSTIYGIKFNLCINGNMGYYRPSLIKEYTMIDSRFKQLIYLVKIWAKTNEINDSTNGIFSSFYLSSMVIHYLQNCQIPILPNPQTPQQLINGNSTKTTTTPLLKFNTMVNCNIIKFYGWKSLKFKSTANNLDIFAILYGFFLYYSKSNHKESIIYKMEKGISNRKSLSAVNNMNNKFILYNPFDNSNNIAPRMQLLEEIKRMEYQLNKLIDNPTMTNCYNTSNTLESIASLFSGSSI